jgi:type VI secretion system secreted protein Hcp
MPIYMKVEGITGEVTESKHKDWIELGSLQWGTSRIIQMPTGAGKSRDAQLPNVSEVMCTKNMDKSSVELLTWAFGGTQGKKVELHNVTVGGKEASHTYLEIILTNALISSFSQSSSGDKPQESLSLNFTKIEYKSTGQDDKGKAASPVSTSWNLAEQKS